MKELIKNAASVQEYKAHSGKPHGMPHAMCVWVSEDRALSIVAGAYVYCTPRKDLESILDYTEVEVALLHKGRIFYSDGMILGHSMDDVLGWVPVDELQELADTWKNWHGVGGYRFHDTSVRI